jgi:hypothetical protein
MSRQILELLAIAAYQSDLITEREVMEILGFEAREDLYDFFKRYNVSGTDYTSEDNATLEEITETKSVGVSSDIGEQMLVSRRKNQWIQRG